MLVTPVGMVLMSGKRVLGIIRKRVAKRQQTLPNVDLTNESTPLKGLNLRIPIVIPIKGRGFTSQGSGLAQSRWKAPVCGDPFLGVLYLPPGASKCQPPSREPLSVVMLPISTA